MQPAEKPGPAGNGRYTIGPNYTTDPDLTDRGNPKGQQFEFKMSLAESRLFSGKDATLDTVKKAVRTERKIFV